MKAPPTDPRCAPLDHDECIEAELSIAACLHAGSLEDAPAQLFLHLLGCPLCLQTAVISLDDLGLGHAEHLLHRLERERAALGQDERSYMH